MVEIRDRWGSLESKVLTFGLSVASVAFNTGTKMFFSTETSAWVDAIGVPSLGLLTLWAVLGFALLRPRAAVIEAACSVPVADVSLA
jgi:hypothetical protein